MPEACDLLPPLLADQLDAVGAHDQALVEDLVRGAGLERHHVASAHLAHHPGVAGIDHERFGYPVGVSATLTILEEDLVPPFQPVQVIEDEVAPGAGPSQAVSGEVDVPLGGVGPRQRGLRYVAHAIIQSPLAVRVEDGDVVEPYGLYRETHYRTGG